MSYNTELQANNEELQSILNTVNALPNADSGGDIDLGVTGATVGQTVKISAVDENGVPTAWESVDFPSGGGSGNWELVAHVLVEEDVTQFDFDFDKAYKSLYVSLHAISLSGTNYWFYVKPSRIDNGFFNGSANADKFHAFRIDCGLGWYEIRGNLNQSNTQAPFQTGYTYTQKTASAFMNNGMDKDFSAATGFGLSGTTFQTGSEMYIYGIPA